MSIFDKLGFADLDVGTLQSVDEMTIIPILGKDITKNASDPKKVKFRRTRTYGQMEFENEDSAGYGIVPDNTVVISEHAAQDHAMSETGIVGSKASKTFDNACCVQQHQGGLLSGDENTFNVLPVGLRKALLSPAKRAKHDFGKLWPDIERWLSDVPGIEHGSGHLEYFFRPFAKELEDFVAEFEPVEGQLGAVVLFNGIPVGLELMPNVDYWNGYWKWLIRGCYGAQLLKMKKAGTLQPQAMKLPKIGGPSAIDEMVKYLDSVKSGFLDRLNALQGAVGVGKPKTELPKVTKRLVAIGNGGGDMVLEDNKPVYLSVIL